MIEEEIEAQKRQVALSKLQEARNWHRPWAFGLPIRDPDDCFSPVCGPTFSLYM